MFVVTDDVSRCDVPGEEGFNWDLKVPCTYGVIIRPNVCSTKTKVSNAQNQVPPHRYVPFASIQEMFSHIIVFYISGLVPRSKQL